MIEYVLILVALGMVAVVVMSSMQYDPIELIILAFFGIVIAIVGVQYFFGVSITASLKELLDKPKIDFTITETTTASKNQVFHVPGKFGYADAKAVCRAYGGKLANIQQVMDAHKAGGEWCDYGWSEDQMALYPTQTKTWQAYKDTEIHEQDCGRPGVNGGYFNNIREKLGANCFAPKPPQSGEIGKPVLPQSPLDKRAEYWKTNLPQAAPFNYEKWDE